MEELHELRINETMEELHELRIKETAGQYLSDMGNGKFIHLKFTDLLENLEEDLDKGLREEYKKIYRVVRKIGTSFSIDPNDAACLKRAAQILVERKIKELKGDDWDDLINESSSSTGLGSLSCHSSD